MIRLFRLPRLYKLAYADYVPPDTFLGLLLRGHLVGIDIDEDSAGLVWGTRFFGVCW